MKKILFLIFLIPLLTSCGEKQSYKIISSEFTINQQTGQKNTIVLSPTDISPNADKPVSISPSKKNTLSSGSNDGIIVQSSSESSDLEKEKILDGIENELNNLFDNVDKLDTVNEANINF